MNEHDRVRQTVSEHYGAAVRGAGGCCAPATGPAGNAAKLAGYREEDLQNLPGEADAPSFGCGNPLAFAGVKPGDVVLDLGSGAGLDLLIAAEKVGPTGRVIGVDMTDDMIERARANIAAAGYSHVEVRKGIIEDLPVETASVDWVISNCVINLSPDKPKVFAEIARVLKPGGRMRVSDIVAQDLPAWVRTSAEAISACIGGAISEEEYLEGLRNAGLEDVAVEERIVYDAQQLEALMDDPALGLKAVSSCCGGTALLNDALNTVSGKVWSAKFTARLPGATQ